MPSQGALLLAHPCLSGSFNRAVVLLCRHRLDQGSYGLIVNRTMQVHLLAWCTYGLIVNRSMQVQLLVWCT